MKLLISFYFCGIIGVLGQNDGLLFRLKNQWKCLDDNGKPSEESLSTILMLTPGKLNIPMELISAIPPHVPQEKSHSYPLTFSGKIDGQCLSLIELPLMYDSSDILETMEWLKDRVFKKIILHFKTNEDWERPEMQVFSSFLKLFTVTYGKDFLARHSAVVVMSSTENENADRKAKKDITHFFQDLGYLPQMFFGLENDPAWFNTMLTKIEEADCLGRNCLPMDSFYKKAAGKYAGTPWIGHPGVMEFDPMQSSPITIQCFSKVLIYLTQKHTKISPQ